MSDLTKGLLVRVERPDGAIVGRCGEPNSDGSVMVWYAGGERAMLAKPDQVMVVTDA